MSAVLRLATLDNRRFQLSQFELPQLTAHLSGLDQLCKALGVIALSQFVDITALELREASELLGPDEAVDSEPDPVTGLPYGIEDTSWFPVPAGMASIDALTQHLERGRPRELAGVDLQAIAAELEQCRLTLAPLETEGGQFHLAAC